MSDNYVTAFGHLPTAEQRVTSDTGGQKGKKPERFSLIPVEPLREIARVYAFGAEKYDDDNWRKGYEWSLSYDALQRHITEFWMGEQIDEQSGLHHLAHAAFHLNALMVFSLDRQYEDFDDRKDN
jgi:hypothetical protein